ncbi:MAG: protein kinase [Rubripirellula sp.]
MSDQKRDMDSLFEAASNIESATERAAFLAESCGDDVPLRRQIDQLLESDQQAGSFLENPPAELDVTIAPESRGRTASLEAGLATAFSVDQAVVVGDKNHSVLKMLGKTLNEVPHVALRESADEGADPIARPSSPELPKSESDSRYQLQGEIARGGMGAIIKGRDTDLGRDLAIKVLLDSHKDKPEVIQRFVEEAQIGGQLQHPGIAPIYELGQFADKRPFFAMKLVKGQTLSKLLADREDATDERARFIGIFEQVCQTMAYAHSRGVIHRDLKPANIMVGAFGEVQVMDWGLAKVLQVGGVADEKRSQMQQGQSIIQTLRSGVGSDARATGSRGSAGSETRMGSVMGTPAYMPPEQALGEIDQMDERADVFGLGAILCEILTGQPPYVADDGELVFRMASRGKLADALSRLGTCGADRDLIALTKHCLELEPGDRPRDAGVLSQRVTKYLESAEAKLRETEIKRAAEAARADAEAAKVAAETERAEAESARASEENRRRRTSLALAASILLLVVIGGGGLLYMKTAEADAQRKHALEMRGLAEQRDVQRKAAISARAVLQATLDQKQAALAWVRDYCMLLAMSGEPEDEQLALQIANQTGEPSTWQMALRGNAEYCRGNDHEAIRLFEEGLELEPADIVLKSLLSKAYATTGDFQRYFNTSSQLQGLTENATNEELTYAAWGMVSEPKNALNFIREVQSKRDSPLADLVYGDIACLIAVDESNAQFVNQAIEKLESSRRLLGNTPHFHWTGLRLRHAARLSGTASDEAVWLDAEARRCIKRLEDFPSSPFAIAHTAFYFHRFGSPQERNRGWDQLLQSKHAGGWQTYAIRARTVRTDSPSEYLEAAAALDENKSSLALFWRAYCLFKAGEVDQAEELYQMIKSRDVNLVVHSQLYYLELVGPLQRLQEESQAYLDRGVFPTDSDSDIAKMKAEFCVKPSELNEQRLRQLGKNSEISIARGNTIGTIGRVRLLQANEAPQGSPEQVIAREKTLEVLTELAGSRAINTGDYYWAESIKQILEEEWGEVSRIE